MLAVTIGSAPRHRAQMQGALVWLPRIDSFRTLCLVPTGEVLAVFKELRGLARPG